MKLSRLFFLFLLASSFSNIVSAQRNNKFSSISVSGGPFIVGHDFDIWLSASMERKLATQNKKIISKFTAEAELYFENATDKVNVYNPTFEQFIHDRFYHESNSGIVFKFNYYPFNKILKGFHVGAGPLIVYSLRTFEKRAQLIQYSPTLSIRMSEMTSDKKLLAGYRVTTGYDINISTHYLFGIRADFLQYSGRDLNSIWGIKLGYLF